MNNNVKITLLITSLWFLSSSFSAENENQTINVDSLVLTDKLKQDTLPSDSIFYKATSDSNKSLFLTDQLKQDTSSFDSVIQKKVSNSEEKSPKLNKDSLLVKQRRDSLLSLEANRLAIFENTDKHLAPFHFAPHSFFNKDVTAPSELLKFHPLFHSARFGLSTTLNRYLPYGNVAPVNKIYTGNLIYKTNNSLLEGTDQTFSTEINQILLQNSGIIRYQNNPCKLAVPEASIMWENGVFNENILLVSFSRPLSENLMINVFSNYRYFRGQQFSHEGNDIYSTYSNLTDTSVLSHKGYNPQTNEHVTGANINWFGVKGSKARLQFTYGDLTNEVALDVPRPVNEMDHARFNRYPMDMQAGYSWLSSNPLFLEIETSYRNEPVIRIKADSLNGKRVPVRHRFNENDFTFAARSGIQISENDSAGILFYSNTDQARLFDNSEVLKLKNRPELFYSHNFRWEKSEGRIDAGAGATLLKLDDSIAASPVWHAGIDFIKTNQRFRGYVQQENIAISVPFDSLLYNSQFLDSYFKAGLEFYRAWNKVDLLLGYQYLYGVSQTSIDNSWILGNAPYRQPRSALILAPSLKIGHGLTLSTSATVSDHKPFLKAHGTLSFMAHPINTREYIDINLSFDYWSEREEILFAGISDWNKPIYNLNLEMAAHIRSFRLFYKVDNLLNRRFAYVPGYFSPGLTFRWGFNWFIQR